MAIDNSFIFKRLLGSQYSIDVGGDCFAYYGSDNLGCTRAGDLVQSSSPPPQYQFRARCQCLLLSTDGHDVVALEQALGISSRTVYPWFNRWESGGLAGLANAAGQGRRPILAAADEPLVVHAVWHILDRVGQ